MVDLPYRAITAAALFAVALFSQQARASPTSPWLTGRWSSDGCSKPSSPGTRFFAPERTRSKDDDCNIALMRDASGLYRAHLTCRYPQAQDDTTDVVFDVKNPMTLDWVNECTKTTYHYCGR